MTLLELLTRVHACEELLEFAKSLGGPSPDFRQLWESINRHDWLTWLMRHCPDQFEDSWRDGVSLAHALADRRQDDFKDLGRGVHWREPEALAKDTCITIRDYIRLRA